MINSISNVNTTVTIPENEQNTTKPLFKGNNNTLERIPEEDSFEKKDNTGKKVGIGVLAAAALAVAGDFVFAKGKHVKKIFGMAEKEAATGKDEGEKVLEKGFQRIETPVDTQSKEAISALNKYLDKTEQLSDKATAEEIKAAYKKALKKNNQNQEAITELNSAYQALKASKTESKEGIKTGQKAIAQFAEADRQEALNITSKIQQEVTKYQTQIETKWNPELNEYAELFNKGMNGIKGEWIEDNGVRTIIQTLENGEKIKYFGNLEGELFGIIKLDKDGNMIKKISKEVGENAKVTVYNPAQLSKEVENITFSLNPETKLKTRLIDYHNGDSTAIATKQTNALYYKNGKLFEYYSPCGQKYIKNDKEIIYADGEKTIVTSDSNNLLRIFGFNK